MCSKPQSSQVAERGSERDSRASPAPLSPVPALTPAQPAEQTPCHAVGSKCGAAGTVPKSRLGILRGPCQQLGVWPICGRCPQLFPDAPACGALSPAPTFVSDALRTQVLWVVPHPSLPHTNRSPPAVRSDVRIGSGCPSPRPSASWLPCCSLQSPDASRWPGGFPRATLSCSGITEEIQCEHFPHVVMAKQRSAEVS